MTKNHIKTFIQIFLLTLSINSISQDENRFVENEKWGYKIGTTVMIEPKFDNISEFAHGVAITKLNNFYGAISEAGVEVIPCIYSGCFYLGQELMAVEKDAKWGVVSLEGKEILPVKYEEIEDRYKVEKYISVKSNGMWGLVNLKDKIIIPCEYEYPLYGGNGLFAVSKNGLAGFINKKNETVIPFQYTLTLDFYNDIAEVYLDTLAGFIDIHNNVIIPIRFDYVYEIEKGLIVVTENNKNGIWTTKGMEIIQPEFTEYYELYNEGIIMIDNDDHFLFDLDGNLLIKKPCTYIEESFIYNEWLLFTQDGKSGIYNMHNHEILLEANYDSFEDYDYGLLMLFNDNKVGLYQIAEGKIIVEPIFDSVEAFNSELFIVTKDGLYGVVRTDGTYLLKMEYSSIWIEDKKIIGAESGTSTLFFNLNGEQITN